MPLGLRGGIPLALGLRVDIPEGIYTHGTSLRVDIPEGIYPRH